MNSPTTPPNAQLQKYFAELGSILPNGSFRSCCAAILSESLTLVTGQLGICRNRERCQQSLFFNKQYVCRQQAGRNSTIDKETDQPGFLRPLSPNRAYQAR